MSAMPARDDRRWLRNVATSYGDLLLGGTIYVLITPFIIHHLGLEAYAVWLISHTLTFYLGMLDLGIGQAHVRFHARHVAQGRPRAALRLAGNVVPALIVAGVVAAVAAAVIGLMPLERVFSVEGGLAFDFRLVVIILGLNLLIALPASALENIYEGEQRFDIRNLRSIVLRIVAVSVQVWLLLQGYGIVALALVELCVSALRACIDLLLVSRLLPGLLRTRLSMDRRVWRRIRPFALWAFVDDLLVEGSAHIDKLLVALLLPMALVTPYALCIAVAGLLLLLAQPIAETFFPMASSLHASGRQSELARVLRTGTKATVAVAAPVAVFLLLVGESLLVFWVAELEPVLVAGLLPLVVVSFFVAAICWTPTLVLMAVNRIRLVACLTLAEIGLSVALMLILVPRLGLLGVAWAVLIAGLLVGSLFLLPAACRAANLGLVDLLASGVARVILAVGPAAVLGGTLGIMRAPFGLFDFMLIAACIATAYLPALYFGGLDAWERSLILGVLRGRSPQPALAATEVRAP
ncbi:O-antigen/teichoic acid export membrane protein [Natronocella acetinitrilica]|uniref:O-antigen/teichoic acid export membrane protein n=1 Tax=Natronocella acetinitrilica TaxID=414046 RepID=A0AAE3G7G2_9GAMM|nr:oligosaccharide flippase family protein [Natronocella acetinitrilica]MCP1675778.1 O-antigen/teichoic acid export membrane protein [Natronocella acetinitrilica]